MNNKAGVKQSTFRNKALHLVLGASLIGSMLSTPMGHIASAEEQGFKIDVQTDGALNDDGSFVESTITLLQDGKRDDVSIKLDKNNSFKHTYTKFKGEDLNKHAKFELDSVLDEKLADKYESIVTGDKNKGFTVYNLKKDFLEGTVTIVYVDENGNEIAKRNKYPGKVGDSYAITPKKITGYKFKEVGNDVTGDIDPETGNIYAEYAYGNTVVKYVYERTIGEEKAEGSVIVRYAKAKVDSEGELVVDDEGRYVIDREIALRDEFSGEIGEEFNFKDSNTVTAKEIYGYKLIGQDSYTGKYEEGIREITFFYVEDENVTKLADVMGGLIVKFVDAKGNEIRERVQQIGKIKHPNKAGETVEADTYSIDINEYIEELAKLGYGYTGVADGSAPLSGVFEKGFKEIVFTFDAIKDEIEFADYSDVFVRYIDENGRDIHARDHFFEKIGTEYNTNAKKIKGYTLKEVKGEPSGTLGSETIHIEYIYTKDGAEEQEDIIIYGGVTVKYVDVNGKDISKRVEIDGRVGDSYKTTEKEIAGYELQIVRGNVEGIIGEGIHTVEYVYVKVDDDTDNNGTDDDGTDNDGTDNDGTDNDGTNDDDADDDGAGADDDGTDDDGTDDDGAGADDDGTGNNNNGNTNDGGDNDAVVAKLLTYKFATDVIENGMTLGDIIAEYGQPTFTDSRGYTWVDEAGNMMLVYGTQKSDVVEELFFFDAEKHEVTAINLSEFYDTIKYGETLDELNKRIGTNGADDMYISANGDKVYTWVSENMNDVMTVSFDADGKAIAKSFASAERFAFSTMSEDGKDDVDVDENRNDSDVANNDDDAQGKPLANTATNMYNWIVLGLGLLSAAGASLFFINRRRTNEDAE